MPLSRSATNPRTPCSFIFPGCAPTDAEEAHSPFEEGKEMLSIRLFCCSVGMHAEIDGRYAVMWWDGARADGGCRFGCRAAGLV